MKSPEIYFGTAGWSYEDWIKVFYPKRQSADFNWLNYYSQYFNAVEVNSTFYTFISPKVAESWLNNVEKKEDFKFILKLNQNFTHKRNYTKEEIAAVKTNLDMINGEGKLGGLLIQFPYSFGCDHGNVDFVKKLVNDFSDYDKFLEVRHKSWQSKSASSLTICTIDQPQIGESVEFEPKVSNNKAYIRFHGRNEEAWKQSIRNFNKKMSYSEQSERYKYLYSPGEISLISQKIKEIFDSAKKIFIIMNNHPNGYAVANAFELFRNLSERKIFPPDTIKNAFPRLNLN